MTVLRRNNLVDFNPANVGAWIETIDEIYDVLGGRSSQKISHDAALTNHNNDENFLHITAQEKADYNLAAAYAVAQAGTHASHSHQVELQKFETASTGAVNLIYEPLPGTITLFIMSYAKTIGVGTPDFRLLLPINYTYSGNKMNINDGIPKNTILYIEYAYRVDI